MYGRAVVLGCISAPKGGRLLSDKEKKIKIKIVTTEGICGNLKLVSLFSSPNLKNKSLKQSFRHQPNKAS